MNIRPFLRGVEIGRFARHIWMNVIIKECNYSL